MQRTKMSILLIALSLAAGINIAVAEDEISNLFATSSSATKPTAQAQVIAPQEEQKIETVATETAQPASATAKERPVQEQPKAQPATPKKPPEFAFPDMPTDAEVASFKAAAQAAHPLTPTEINLHKAATIAEERAAAFESLTPISVSLPVSLESGITSPEIFMAPNKATTLILLDSAGNPWPVHKTFAPGQNEMIDAKETKSDMHNVFVIIPKYALEPVDTNLVLPLKPISENETALPITVRFSTTKNKKYHERVELRIQRAGPNAPAAVVSDDVPNLTDPIYQSVLDGIPNGMIMRKTDTAGVSVWEDRRQKLLYLRTNYRLLSPARDKEGQSADGTWAYRLPLTPSLLLSNNSGERLHVKIQGVGDE